MVDSTAKKFIRAARQRFAAANKLLALELNIEAVYLAGYTVECALKALLIERTAPRRRRRLIDEAFRGRRGHDFEMLRQMLRRLSCHLPPDVALQMTRVQTWSTDLRYQVGFIETEDTQAFLDAAGTVLRWVERSL